MASREKRLPGDDRTTEMTTVSMPTRSEVLRAIGRAFPLIPIPPKDSVGSFGGGVEADAVDAFFADRRWIDITCRELTENYQGDEGASLSFMSRTAQRYYLPAYLTMAIVEHDCPQSILLKIIYFLSFGVSSEDWSEDPKLRAADMDRRESFESFSATEVRAIGLFLQYLARTSLDKDCRDEAERALQSYWSERLVKLPEGDGQSAPAAPKRPKLERSRRPRK